MVSVISLIGIVFGLCALIFLAYKGHSIIWVAPVCAAIVAVMGGLDILDTYLGDYIKGQSCKSCPGTNFFGGNTKKAFEENLLPLICEGANPLKSVDEINDIVWELINAGIVTDGKLWLSKCKEDKNIYHLCRKMANYLRGTL